MTHDPTSWAASPMAAVVGQTQPLIVPSIMAISEHENLFYDGRINSLFGDSETGKTLLTIVATIQTVRNGGRGLIIDFEDSIQGLARLLAAFDVSPEEAARIYYINPEEPLDGTYTTVDFAAALEVGPSIVVIDGIGQGMALHGLNPNHQPDVAKFLRTIAKPAAATGAAVITIDHVTRDPEKRTQAIGSIEKKAAVSGASFEVRLIKAFAPGSEGKAVLKLNKDRPGGIRRFHPGLHPNVTTFIIDSTRSPSVWSFEATTTDGQPTSDWRPTYYMEQVSFLLESAPDPLSQSQVESMLAGDNKHIRRALTFLVVDGFVKMEPGPRNSKLHSTIRKYRQDDPGGTPVDPGDIGVNVTPVTPVSPSLADTGDRGHEYPPNGSTPVDKNHRGQNPLLEELPSPF